MRLLAIALLLLSLGSCVSQRACEKKFPGTTTTKDSVVIKDSVHVIEKVETKTIVKDSIVYTAAVKDSGEFVTSENGVYKFKNDKVSIKLVVKDGKVKYFVDISATESRYNSRIDSLTSELQTYKSRDSISTHSQETIKPAPSEKVKWYNKLLESAKNILAFIGLIFTLYFAGKAGIRYFFKV